MSPLKNQKINQLLQKWLKGTIYTIKNLNELGYNKDLMKRYKKSNWVESIGIGAYKLKTDKIEWFGTIYSLQNQLKRSIHPGGKTALLLKGYGHYIPNKIKDLFLFGLQNESLPKWFKYLKFNQIIYYKKTKLFKNECNLGLIDHKVNNITIKISSPERAILEMLYLVPKYHSTNESMLVMENLTTLRSKLVQELLEKCNSIKVKRLFIYLAEKHNYLWFKELNLKNINLGNGKRVIDQKGKLNNKYKIVIND